MLIGCKWDMVGFGTVEDSELAFEVIIVGLADVRISLDDTSFIFGDSEGDGRQHCICLVECQAAVPAYTLPPTPLATLASSLVTLAQTSQPTSSFERNYNPESNEFSRP